MNLTNATVTGFFSLPSPSLAEANPEAYNRAMAEAPAGSGSCAHCGTGIRNHVVIRTAEGTTAFIGTQCAIKVGEERVKQSVRERLTEEQLVAREQKVSQRRAADADLIAKVAAERDVRYESLKDIVDALRAQQTDFHISIASQLLDSPLSDRQACYAMKVLVGRETKKNSDQWWSMYERITGN